MAQFQAPALDNGLAILELIAKAGEPVGFNAIDAQLPVSRASTARFLKVLQNRGWIAKEESSGKYRLDSRACGLIREANLPEVMRDHSTHILPSLIREAQNTCLLIHWDGSRMRCLNKETHIGSVSMQPIGNETRDLSHAPWGWTFYENLDKAAKVEARKHFGYRKVFRDKYDVWIEHYHRHGFTYDDQFIYKHLRRLGTPVFDNSGRIVGALGMGGSPLTIKNGQVKQMGEMLREHARQLSHLLGWNESKGETQ